MTTDFSNIYPWSDISTVTIDGQVMVKIPKFYIKVDAAPAGSQQAGKKCWWVSQTAQDGYHIHPAFVHNSAEMPCFYIGAYEACNAGNNIAGSLAGQTPWTPSSAAAIITACAARNTGTGDGAGWHLANVYERAAISLLILIQIGTPDVQAAIGKGSSQIVKTGASNANWRGIYDFWGNIGEYVDGAITDSNNILKIFSNKGDGTYVSTNNILTPLQYIQDVFTNKVSDDLNYGDLFVPSSSTSVLADGTFKAQCSTRKNGILLQSGGYNNTLDASGIFLFMIYDFLTSLTGFRLAKYGN